MKRGSLVYDRADRRHVGVVKTLAWRNFGVAGLATVRWIETGWLSTVEIADLRIAPASSAPSTAEERRGRFEFPGRDRR